MKLKFCIIRKMISILLLVFLLYIFLKGNKVFASEASNNFIDKPFNSNSILVMMKKGYFYEDNRQIFAGEEVVSIEDLTKELDRANEHYQQILRIDLNSNVNKYVEKIQLLDFIDHIGFNEIMQLSTSANDPDYVGGEQWGLEKINIEGAWSYTTGSKKVRVGIIDSGIGIHNDLKDNVVEGYDFYKDDNWTIDDTEMHGTRVAGIIGAKGNNKTGMTGVCWDVTLVPLQVQMVGKAISLSATIKAVAYAIASYETAQPIQILNFSNGGYKEVPEFESILRQYPGLVICAAGNMNFDIDTTFEYPAYYGSSLYEKPLENLIVVGNSDKDDTKAYQSGYGKKSVNLFAPGQDIYSTIPGDKYGYDSGTSFATPFVTGVAALLLSKYPNMTPSEVKASILMNVDKISSLSEYCTTGGRLNAYKALSNPHFHSFRYIPKTVSHHQKYCDCGLFSFPLEEHLYLGGNCAVCNAPHTHSYSTQYYNKLGHIEKCICGQTIGSPSPHVITYEDAHDGDNKAICLGCNAELDLRYDGAQINPFSLINRQETKNGSYILSDGIIVLVEEDIEAYFNGTLVFSNHLSI